MTRFDVRNLRVGEELLDSRHSIVRNILRLSATNKECRAVVMVVIRFLEREIGHMIQRAADDRERNTELKCVVFLRAYQVGEKELTDGKRLGQSLACETLLKGSEAYRRAPLVRKINTPYLFVILENFVSIGLL